MIGQLIRLLLAASMAAVFVSCSVKEDRTGCPCWLELDISGCTQAEDVTIGTISGETAFMEKVRPQDCSGIYAKEVKKGMLSLYSFSVAGDMSCKGKILTIPAGKDCAAIWAMKDNFPCEQETISRKLKLHKQFTDVKITFRGSEDQSLSSEIGDVTVKNGYKYVVESDINGIDMEELTPYPGIFMKELIFDDWHSSSVRLPRHKVDSNLKIRVYEHGNEVEVLPLDNWIRKTGFDWTAEDLGDVEVGIDYAKSQIEITVNDWEKGNSDEIIFEL